MIAYTTARGTKIEIALMRNQKLGVNGWIPSSQSEIALKINGATKMFCGLETDTTHGLCIRLIGKNIVPVPAEHQATLTNWVEELRNQMDAVIAADDAASDYALKIERISNGDQAA